MKLPKGFTLIELLVVLAIIATLLSLAAPRYITSISKADEAVLKENLSSMRLAIDHYYNDTGKYPSILSDLVTKRYLRRIPVDPLTGSDATWVLIAPSNSQQGTIFDVKSGANGNALGGTAFRDW